MNDDWHYIHIKMFTEGGTLEWGIFYTGVSCYNDLFYLEPWEAINRYKKLGIELMLKDHEEYIVQYVSIALTVEAH